MSASTPAHSTAAFEKLIAKDGGRVDYVFGDEMMLRYSLVYVPAVILLIAVAAGLAGLKPYIRSLDYLKRWSEEHEK